MAALIPCNLTFIPVSVEARVDKFDKYNICVIIHKYSQRMITY